MSFPPLLDQVVLLNNEPPLSRFCFVCGLLLTEEGRKIVGSETSCTHIPVANKLGGIVGSDFCIIISEFDEICGDCIYSINQIDELEYSLSKARNSILNLLETKYNLSLKETVLSNDDLPFKDTDLSLEEAKDDKVKLDSSELGLFVVSDENEDSFNDVGSNNKPSCNCCDEVTCTKAIHFNLDDQVHNEPCNTISEIKIEASLDNETFYSIETSRDEISKNVLCEYCCRTFYSEKELEDHVGKCHLSNEDASPMVSSLHSDHDEIIENTDGEDDDSKISNMLLKCGLYGFNNDDKQNILKSLQSGKKVSCEMCGDSFEKMSTLLVHYMSHRKNEGVCSCKICEMPFPNKQVLARHLIVHENSEGPITCNICGKVCHDTLHAVYHRRIEHSTIKDLSCGLCNTHMGTYVELKHHILTSHRGKKEYKCKECDKTFSRQLQYDNHRNYAHGNSQCRICGKRIENNVKLRQHELRHARTESKKFECDVCHKVFKTPGGLKVHSVSHTGKYKFFCEFCGRGFMSTVILEEHKGVHTKEERYVCDICGRKFVLYSTFHLHKQWHKDPYPFPCKMCSRKFRYRSERSNHVRRDHTGETPYKCEHCHAAFIKLSYLKKHLVVHTKIHPHICHICDKGYDQKKSLARHYAKVHNDPTLLQSFPKTCQYKVALRPEEYPDSSPVH